MPTNIAGKRVLILQQRGWGVRIGHPLARRLAETGAVLAAVTVKRATHRFTVEQRDVAYESIYPADNIKENPQNAGDLDNVSLAEICSELGIESVWPLAQASRNHVSSYRDRFYYGFRQNQSDSQIGDFIKGTFLHVRRCFDDFRPDILVLPNFAGLQHIIFSLMAEKRGVPACAAIDSKVRNVQIFARDHLAHRSNYLDRLVELRNGATSSNIGRAEEYIAKNRERLSATSISTGMAQAFAGGNARDRNELDLVLEPRVGLLAYVRALRMSVAESIAYLRSGHTEHFANLGVTNDFRPPRFIFRDHFMAVKYRRVAECYPYAKLDNIGKFVFLPLQVQPEATLNIQAPRFNNQIELARQVAMSLPGDHTLVVKDHPNMTWRHPPSYIDKIARTPNVKLVDFRIRAESILRRASVLVSPSSSTIAEAALLGVPCIQLGDLGTTAAYPNVTRHCDLSTLSKAILDVLATSVDSATYDADLNRYIAAAFDVGVESKYHKIWAGEISEEAASEDMKRFITAFVGEIDRLLGQTCVDAEACS